MSATIRRTAISVATALLLAAALVPAVSAADCTDGILSCDVTGAEQTDAAPVTIDAVSTVLALRADAEDPSVYSRAYGTYLSLMDGASFATTGPAVGLDVRTVTDATGAETTEETVAIRVSRNGEDGWQVISRTVSEGAADQQAVGIPAVQAAAPVTSLTFAEAETTADGVLEAFTTRDDVTYGLTPVLEGDTLWRITEAARPTVPVADVAGQDPVGQEGLTALSEPTAGEVTYAVAADLDEVNGDLPALFVGGRSLGDMVELEGTATGMAWTTDALLVTQADNTEDASGPLPVEPPPLPTDLLPAVPTSLTIGANDVTTGSLYYANNENTIVAGTQLYQTNVDTQAHPVVCADFSGKQLRNQCRSEGFNNTGDVAPVVGTEDLAPGTYYYVCQIHSGQPKTQTGMWGTFEVVG